MFKAIVALMAALALAAITTTAVEARSVNIHARTIEVTESSTAFEICGKVTGLAGGFTYQAEVSGTISGSFQCENPGGQDPPPKDFSTSVVGTGTFTAANNGNGEYCVETIVPTPDPAEECPNRNWAVNLLSYSGTVTLEICDAVTNPNPPPALQRCGSGTNEADAFDSESGINVSFTPTP